MSNLGLGDSVDTIRDPIHGYIGITEYERDLIDTKEVQRLRDITQLGATDRVYPSATHDRFLHSIGVMHLAGKLGDSLGLTEREITAVRIAGLLHDTGHGPYSHTSENVAELFGVEHEDLSCEVVDFHSDKIPVDIELVKDAIRGNSEPNIIAGILDVDRMDYLVRDGYYTGVQHGSISIDTLIRFSTLTPDSKVAMEYKGVPSLNEFLGARLRMYQAVYTHNSVSAFDVLLRKSLFNYCVDNSVYDLMKSAESEIHNELLDYNPYVKYMNRNKPNNILEKPRSELDDNIIEYLDSHDYNEIENMIRNNVEDDIEWLYVRTPMNMKKSFSTIPIKTKEDKYIELGDYSNLSTQFKNEYDNTTQFTIYAPSCNKKEILRVFDSI